MKPHPFVVATAGLLAATGCATAQPTLKDAFKDKFLIGAALNESQFTGQNATQAALIKKQFNSITPENVMKWEIIHPNLDKYNFGPSDRFVTFGETNRMFIVGHTLVWHSQTPKWVFEDGQGHPVAPEQSHPHRRGPLPRPHPRLGRGERGAQRRRHAAGFAVEKNHRRRLSRESI
jgi:endo-1,4-beta-xylanase